MPMGEGRNEFPLPPLGGGSTEATILNWSIDVGDRVVIDRPICSVDADGAVLDLTSPFAGIVAALGAPAGEAVSVGQMLLAVTDDATEHSAVGLGGAPTRANDGAVIATADADDGRKPHSDAEPVGGALNPDSDVRPAYSPLVRRLADEFEVDLDTLTGTGPNGRITRDDVHRAAFPDEPLPGRDDADTDQTGGDTADTDGETLATGTHTSQGRGRATFSLTIDIDASQLVRAHERLASRSGRSVQLDALLVKLVLPVLGDFGELAGDVANPAVGFLRAAATGPVADVVAEAAQLTLADIELAMSDQVSGHRTGDEPIVAPLTVLDAGALGVTATGPPLPIGGAAVVAVGRPTQAHAPTMTVAATFDEDAIDLVRAAAFLTALQLYLEDPILAFVD